ncbi:MAG: DUF4097 family beta strand repeat-containing protein, partial [Polyangiaceae bacterium]
MNQEMVIVMSKETDEVQTRWELPFGEIAEIALHADAFSILVEPVEDGGTPRIETSGKSRKAPDITVTREGNVVRVHVGMARGIPFLDWIVGPASTLHVRVPADIRGRIHTGAGTLRARDLENCQLELVTDVGTIKAERLHGKLRLLTSAGTIDGTDLAGSLDVETSAGTIDLSVLALDPGSHRVHTSAGTVRVDLARDVVVRVDASSSFGGARVKFPSSPDAAATLAVSSDAGTVRVRESHGRGRSRHHHEHAEWRQHHGHARSMWNAPYRQPAPAVVRQAPPPPATETNDAELDRVLKMVAEGTLSPEDAGEV